MKIFCALVLLMLVSAPASSETIYVRPDGDPSTTRYLWGDDVITNGVSVAEAITLARAANGSRPLEIRLLRRAETPDTSYSVDLASTEAALRWRGSETNRLIIRGQVDRSGSLPRPLTIIVGRRSLRQILCVPQGIDLCAAPPRDGPTSRRQDLLDFLSGELEAENGQKRAPAKPDIPLRLNCLLLWNAAFVEITDVGFRECWLAAVATYASSNIALRGSVIEGSTYAFAAIAKQGVPESAHTFEIAGNLWRQSASTYRSSPVPCDVHEDWSCPVSIWADVPWAVVHHYFWSPLNGALFTGKDILGDVRIVGNRVIDAYNGVRVRLSKMCLGDAHCRGRANAGFEIVDNRFEKIRDNAIEPEGRAEYWIIKHNTFIDRWRQRTRLPRVREHIRPRRSPRFQLPGQGLGGKQAICSQSRRRWTMEHRCGGRKRCALLHPHSRDRRQNGSARRRTKFSSPGSHPLLQQQLENKEPALSRYARTTDHQLQQRRRVHRVRHSWRALMPPVACQ
jgi:hypothetical protein